MKKLYKCAVCSKFYGEEEAREFEFCCPNCRTLLVKVQGEKTPEVRVEEFFEADSESFIGYGVWTIYRTQSGRLVCNCPGFLKHGVCKHCSF